MKRAPSGFRVCTVMALLATGTLSAGADLQVCILRGAGGETFYDARFEGWSQRLSDVLTTTCEVSPRRIHRYPADAVATPLTRETAQVALAAVAEMTQPGDTLLLLLIGHGSMQLEPKFMVSGPDISAADFKDWLDAVPAATQIVINTASASAAFINQLSRPDRIVITSTRGADQPNATEYMEHLVQVLENGRGDADRNGRLTLVEWSGAAAAATAQWYESENFIATEDALLDDNGDGLGTRLPLEPVEASEKIPDGAHAAEIIIKDDLLHAQGDARAVAAYREAIIAVEAWKKVKASVDAIEYWTRLEELLVTAARLNLAISATPEPAPTTALPEGVEVPEEASVANPPDAESADPAALDPGSSAHGAL